MIRQAMLYTVVLFLGLLAGCSAPGAKFSGLQTVAQSNAELVIYRKSALFASGQNMPVLVDGKRSGELYNGSFLQQELAPGSHVIKVTTGMMGQPAETTISLAAGERRYLHFNFPADATANVFFIGVALTERSEAEALAELKELSSAKPAVPGKQN